jgi:hypothetical protein
MHARSCTNTLKGELNPICHLLALLGAHNILHVSKLRVKAVRNENFPVLANTLDDRRYISDSLIVR